MTATRSAVPVLLTLTTLSCAPIQQPPPDLIRTDRGTVDATGRPVPIECLNDSSTLSVPLAQQTKGIPGYHDCQRLIVGEGLPEHFGPLVQIFASENLDRITRQEFEQAGGMPVAQLYNFSSWTYPVPRIEPQYSCLYLKLLDNSSWEARLIHKGGDDTCPILTQWPAGGPLQVPSPTPPAAGQPFPAVARWDWDGTRRRNYMAVKCLDHWCEIGVGLNKSPQYGGEQGPPKPTYDQQMVAIQRLGILWPGPAATLVPAPGLAALRLEDFDCPAPCMPADGWVRVADMDLPQDSDHYRRKLNLSRGVNQMFIRRRLDGNREEWQSRIISARGDTAYFEIHRTPHDHEVPAVARWLWYDDDERAWVRCALGCCESGSEITLD